MHLIQDFESVGLMGDDWYYGNPIKRNCYSDICWSCECGSDLSIGVQYVFVHSSIHLSQVHSRHQLGAPRR